ncbi:hypothetical protein AAG906_040510 [Vitis piasezkii]
MVHQGIVLGHIISKQSIEVDKAKVELIVKFTSPTNVKGVWQFLGYLGSIRVSLTKQDAKAKLIRWILLLQEFNLQIKDKKEVENVVVDHLPELAIAHNSYGLPINDDFPDESLMLVEVSIGHHFSKMPTPCARVVIDAGAWEVDTQEHDAFDPILVVDLLMFGALTSWNHSLCLLATLTS